MSRLVTFLAAGAAFATLTFASAQAMPIQVDPGASSSTTLISGGCGYYRHRGPYGGCRPGGGWRRGYYGYRGYYRRRYYY